MPLPLAPTDALASEARYVPDSGIVEVMDYGFDRSDVLPFWAGEGDLPTPKFITDAAARSLADGETFYTYQRGLPELREELVRYHQKLYGLELPLDRIVVTGSGMQSIQLALRCAAGPGDSVLVPTPSWPNAMASVGLNSARPIPVPMSYEPRGWQLDLDQLFAAADETTKAIFINSPCNPTGWVIKEEEAQAILGFARQRGLWVIADEIYARFFYGKDHRAPSFLDISDSEDRIIYVNTFSKNWAMTGWRIGWMVIPEEIVQKVENLVQYSTSGVAVFMQRGALAAVRDGDSFLQFQVDQSAENLRIIEDVLGRHNRVDMAKVEGAFYAYFSIRDIDDTLALAFRLVDEASIGLAPGMAFGPGGERFMRMCFARKPSDIEIALDRLVTWLNR